MNTTNNGNGTELMVRPGSELAMPVLSIQQAIQRRNEIVTFVKQIMVEGEDFGVIPGTIKKTLLKPGAEKLTTFFGMTPRFELVEKIQDWTGGEHGGEPLFYFFYRCRMFRNKMLVAESDASANSREGKHRWRWVSEKDLPPGTDKAKLVTRSGTVREPDFAIRKRETGGKYGKPEAYWDRFEQAIADKTARLVKLPKKNGPGEVDWWEIGDVQYRVPNDDIASQINTLQKMAQKRALVGTTLLAVNASEFFTQDVEDMEMLDGGFAPAATGSRPPPPAQEEIEYQVGPDGEPDLSHAPTFYAEWDRAMRERRFSQETGRNFLNAGLRRVKKTFDETDADWRREKLDRLAKGEFDDVLRGKPANGAANPPAADKPAEPATKPAAETKSAGPASPAEKDASSGLEPTAEDVKTLDGFKAWMFDYLPQATPEQATKAIESWAKKLGRTPEQVTVAGRMRAIKAAREGRFTVPDGEILNAKPAEAAAATA